MTALVNGPRPICEGSTEGNCPEEKQLRPLTSWSKNTDPEEGKHSVLFAPKLIIKANISIWTRVPEEKILRFVKQIYYGKWYFSKKWLLAWTLTWTQARGSEWRLWPPRGPRRAWPPCLYPAACFTLRYLWTAFCSLHLHLQATIISCLYFQEPPKIKKPDPCSFLPSVPTPCPWSCQSELLNPETWTTLWHLSSPSIKGFPISVLMKAKARCVAYSENLGNLRVMPGRHLWARSPSA